MRTPLWIAVVAVAGIVVAWLVLTRSPEPRVAAVPATHVPATTAIPAPPATTKESEATTVRAQTQIPPPEPPAVETKPAPAPVAVVPPKPTEPAATEVTSGDDSDASANDDSADEPEPAEEEPDSQSFDAHRAADLMADWMAKQDVAAGDGSAPVPSSKSLKAFDEEQADAEWSAAAQRQIEATLNQWLDALPDDVSGNLDMIHVECRQTLCQILAAETSIVPEGHAAYEQQWIQGIDTLARQPWFTELGFVDVTTAVDHDTESGYFLYQVYLRREVKTPSE